MAPARTSANAPGTLSADLFAPGMTALHRVGLAGLAMTLRALEADPIAADLRAEGSWEISERAVTLSWSAEPDSFFPTLLARSFRLTEQGLIWFPALGYPLDYPGQAQVLHNALLGTFLQHAQSRRSAGNKQVSIAVEIDQEHRIMRFLPLAAYAHQRVDFNPTRPVKVAGWLYPGGTVRHVQATARTSLTEDPSRALALLFAPVGALYFQIHRKAVGVRPQYCLVLPDVSDLEAYMRVRQLFSRHAVERLHVAGTVEAAVRVLTELEAHEQIRALRSTACVVMAFGTAPWSKQQKTRVEVFTVVGTPAARLTVYRRASRLLPPKHVTGKVDPRTGELTQWWEVPQTPDLVARNIVANRPWWSEFAQLWEEVRQSMNREQRQWALQHESKGLHAMVNDRRIMPQGPEEHLVRACQEAWRRRLGALGERARSQGIPFHTLAGREHERVRISFARCKNAAMLRQTLTDFWSRAGSLPELQDTWPQVLPLLQDRWQAARDLALLALASYKPQTKEEADALTKDIEMAQEEVTT